MRRADESRNNRSRGFRQEKTLARRRRRGQHDEFARPRRQEEQRGSGRRRIARPPKHHNRTVDDVEFLRRRRRDAEIDERKIRWPFERRADRDRAGSRVEGDRDPVAGIDERQPHEIRHGYSLKRQVDIVREIGVDRNKIIFTRELHTIAGEIDNRDSVRSPPPTVREIREMIPAALPEFRLRTPATVKPAAVRASPARPASFAGGASLPDLKSSLPITSANRISAAWLELVRTVSASTTIVSRDSRERHDGVGG